MSEFKNLILVAVLVITGCNGKSASKDSYLPHQISKNIIQVGYINHPSIKESSGIIPCGYNTNLFWTHNDGAHPNLYAIDRTGKCVAEFVITGVNLSDFEDIARDNSGKLYIGDIGNNDARRAVIFVHCIDEPDPKRLAGAVPVKKSWRLVFPERPFDCEALFIYHDTAYLISKVFNDAQAGLYKFNLNNTNNPITLEFIGNLQIKSPVTSADISPSGKLLAVTAQSGLFVFNINGDVSLACKLKPFHIRFKDQHIEGCCFVLQGVLATSELRGVFLFKDDRLVEK